MTINNFFSLVKHTYSFNNIKNMYYERPYFTVAALAGDAIIVALLGVAAYYIIAGVFGG